MKLTVTAILLLSLLCVPAAAQDDQEGRIGIGESVTHVAPRSDDLSSPALHLRPLIRLQPGRVWGFAGAFNWFDTDVDGMFIGMNRQLAVLEIKPLMGGVGYTIPAGRVRTTFSVVAGPAWNRLKFKQEVRDELAAAGVNLGERLDKVSFAVRPGASVSIRIAPRLDLTGFGGYLFNRPKFDIPTPGGDVRNEWTTDGIVLSGGMVVSVF
jgi:hypothetical protein